MKNLSRRFYRGRGAGRIIAAVIAGVVVLALIIYAILFFGLRKYAVYTPDGLRLEVPWLQEETVSEVAEEP